MVSRRVAVVGAGPSGLYATAALLRSDEVGAVDVIEATPHPYGLVRYGVAPDHARTKKVSAALARVFADPRVRFVGNARLGADLTREDLLSTHDAVLYAMGASRDRSLGIPGEDLAGSVGATEVVGWYCGHPDVPVPLPAGALSTVAVVGAGNVALDLARVMLRSPTELARTDMPRAVVDTLSAAAVTRVHVLVRRGPQHVKWSLAELHELLHLDDVQVRLHCDPSELDPADHEPRVRSVLARLQEAHQRVVPDATKALDIHFWTAPTRVLGDDRVTGVVAVTSPPTGATRELEFPAAALVRAIGFHGEAVADLPFDADRGVVPNTAGAVSAPGHVGREFVVGWLKRGPSGVIGTNKSDAAETVATLLATWGSQPDATDAPRRDLVELLRERGVRLVDWPGVEAIVAEERARGQAHGSPAVVIADRAELLDIATRARDH